MSHNIEKIVLKREMASLTPEEEAVLVLELRDAYQAQHQTARDPLNVRIVAEAVQVSGHQKNGENSVL